MFDCDNTLFDNDRLKHDLGEHLARTLGSASRDRYWTIYERLREELGYADFLGAIQELRIGEPYSLDILNLSTFLIDYPFRDQLLPNALKVLHHFRRAGEVVIVTDGDGVFQPIKLKRSGLWDAVDGNIELFVHKVDKLDEIRERHPASHHLMVGDRPAVLTGFKAGWGSMVTTVFVRQGHYAAEHVGSDKPTGVDVMIDSLAELLELPPESLARPEAGTTPAKD